MKISAVIITYNEEKNILAALESVSWADEVIVVDSNSTDQTAQIAAEYGASVIVRDWPGFSEQKQFGVDAASHEWILSLDADERVTPELKDEIAGIKAAGALADAYRIPRLSIYMGREIRHSGWYPDKQRRLFDRRKGKWNGRPIHESVEMSPFANIGDLRSDIRHFSVESAEHHHRMIGERYAPLAAKHLFQIGVRTSRLRVVSAGPIAFLRSYVLKLGFLDGFPGFCIARFAAYHAYLKQLLLWEMQASQTSEAKRAITTKPAAETSKEADFLPGKMKRIFAALIFIGAGVTCSLAQSTQKGIDTQTQKIKDEANKTTSRPTDVNRSFDWGKGKTPVRERLPNPYKLNSRRDVLIEAIRETLKEKRLVVDELSSRPSDGIIVTQPYVFGKGPVIAQAELRRYGVLEYTDTAWSRGQYSLTIEVQPIDGIQNNVSVIAKVEGRSGNGLSTEWVTVRSSGLAEEEFLVKLVEAVTGKRLDEVPNNE